MKYFKNLLPILLVLALSSCHHDDDEEQSLSVPPPAEPELRAETITWITPTENTDGTPLTDLAGYYLFYGTSTEDYVQIIEPYHTSYTVHISNDLHHFTMKSFNIFRAESDFSNVVWR